MYAQVRAMDPLRADAALAALFVVASVIEVFAVPSGGDNLAVTVAAAVAAQSALAWRRRSPLLAAVVFALAAALQAVAGGFLTQDTTVHFLAAMLLLYSTGRYADERTFRIAFPAMMVGSGIALTVEAGLERAEYFFWFLCLYSLPALVGRALRHRARLQDELRKKTELIERQRADRALSAVEDERERIASELQAVVANSLSAMVVRAETVPRVLAADEPEHAERVFAAIEETGRDALVEMRRLLGVLRRDGDRAEPAPQPGLGRLDALVERARDTGLDVTVREEGDSRPLAPGIDLTSYRIVQDALEAAVEQGASKAQVLVRYGERELVLGVRDDREGGPSHRLPDLRDRARLYVKDVPADQLVAGIRLVAQGDALLAPSVTRRLIEEFSRSSRGWAQRPAGLDELTPREVEVFKLLARGMSNSEIAGELIVSETTVKTHVARILMKLGVRDRVQAVALAYESGVVAPGEIG